MEQKKGLRIGIINIGTFLQKEEEVVEMMEKRNIEVLGISETRDKITGRRALHNNYVYFKSSEDNGKHGVDVIVSEKIGQYVSSFEYVNNRLMKTSVRTQRQKLVIIQIYAPQQGRPKAEKEDFFISYNK